MTRKIAYTVGLLIAVAVSVTAAAVAEESAPAGKQAFMELKCNLCHSVPAAGIESKTKSEKIKGPDLLAGEWDKELLAKFIKKEAKAPDGSEHKKEFKGSDEELQALVDWLLEQKAE